MGHSMQIPIARINVIHAENVPKKPPRAVPCRKRSIATRVSASSVRNRRCFTRDFSSTNVMKINDRSDRHRESLRWPLGLALGAVISLFALPSLGSSPILLGRPLASVGLHRSLLATSTVVLYGLPRGNLVVPLTTARARERIGDGGRGSIPRVLPPTTTTGG